MSKPLRPSWDAYFLDIAETVARRADCTRRQAGAVVVKDNRIVGTGYNGAPSGGPSCLRGECPRGQLSYDEVAEFTSYDSGPGFCIAIHAEMNAILYSSREDREGATIYITSQPCPGCQRLIRGSGIVSVYWPDGHYRV